MATAGPYSPVYQADTFYFISGQVGVEPNTKSVSSDIEEQTRQVMENLRRVLDTVGLQMNAVVKTIIFLKDIEHYQSVNKVYTSYFNQQLPARSCVEVSALPNINDQQLLIEIEAVAYRKSSP
jgi:2-iminobutanoate/2-iminopropanoate deaminase